MSILQYNGSAIIAMTGKNCVAIASDLRYGVQQTTLACDMQKVFRLHDKLYIGLSGLTSDVQTVMAKTNYKMKLYALREERQMKPSSFANMFSSMLYEKRFGPFFVEPVVAGLEDTKEGKNTPFICGMDLIGAPVYTNDFILAGTCSEQMYGMCEAMYKPDMEPEDLFETISQCLLASVDRDCLSGWGAVVHIITPDKVETRQLKGRMD